MASRIGVTSLMGRWQNKQAGISGKKLESGPYESARRWHGCHQFEDDERKNEDNQKMPTPQKRCLMSTHVRFARKRIQESPCLRMFFSSQFGDKESVSRLVWPRTNKPSCASNEGNSGASSKRCASEVDRRPMFFSP